ncbi:MAG: hypothetical protein E7435_02325 [Ruminococcaceae bacterium]|nr:hypothetical protein [Oscillospiraceae bacterium]
MFLESKLQHIGVVDLSNCTLVNYLFSGCSKLETVDKLVLSDKMTNFILSNFAGCSALKNITFDGVIPTSISMDNSPLLTTASVQSIIDHLKDLTGANAQTLTFHATVGEALTDAQKAAITAKNWTLVY